MSHISVNSLRPRLNRRHFADDTFRCFFVNEKVWISIKSSLKFVPKGPINNIPTLVQIMAWRRPGDKPLSEPMMVRLPTHICVTRPQWVNASKHSLCNILSHWLRPDLIIKLHQVFFRRFIDISVWKNHNMNCIDLLNVGYFCFHCFHWRDITC